MAPQAAARPRWANNALSLRIDHAALLADVGPLKAMLDRIILDGTEPHPRELPDLRGALDKLGVVFGLGGE